MNTVYLNWFTNDKQFPFFIQYGGHEEDTILHTHDDFTELVIVLNGNATHIVNSETYFIKKGNVFVINEDTPHAYINPHEFIICNIMFRPEIIRSAGPDLSTSNGFQALFVLEPYYRNIHSFQSRLSLSMAIKRSHFPVPFRTYHLLAASTSLNAVENGIKSLHITIMRRNPHSVPPCSSKIIL